MRENSNISLFEGYTTLSKHLWRVVSECEVVLSFHLEINLNIGTAVFNHIIQSPAITALSKEVLRRARSLGAVYPFAAGNVIGSIVGEPRSFR